MAIVKISPSEIFFSQDSISNCFGSYTRHHNKTIGETLDDIISGKCAITSLPTINVIKKGNNWVTADNRRLWVFKKLQKLEKCHTITAVVTDYIKPTKCHILANTRVRGYEGGTLWRSLESKQHNPDYRKSVTQFFSEREASLDSMSQSDRTEYSSESSSQMFSMSDSTLRGYRSVVRRTGYSGLAATSFKDPTAVMASKFSSSFSSVYQNSCETLQSKSNSVETSSGKVAWPEEENVVRQTYVHETMHIVRLNPLDVEFAGGLGYFVSFDGNLIGEFMDKHLQILPQRTVSFKLKVFKYQGKYFSEERLHLWMIQSLNRYSDKFTIAGHVVPAPANILTMQLRDSLKSIDIVGGEKWKNMTTLNSLPTKKRKRLNLADILYSRKTILDIYKGHSIVKELIKVFSFETASHELSVIEHNGKYYALENKKLWILKNAEIARGPLTVTGNVKISMDYIMFHSFTSDNIREVDIKMEIARHTVEERFMLEYIRRKKPS